MNFVIVKGTVMQSYNNKYMIASAIITNTENFAILFVLVFKLFSRKVLLMNKKNSRNC